MCACVRSFLCVPEVLIGIPCDSGSRLCHLAHLLDHFPHSTNLPDRTSRHRVIRRRRSGIAHKPSRPATDTELHSVAGLGVYGQPHGRLVYSAGYMYPCSRALDAPDSGRGVIGLCARVLLGVQYVFEDVEI